MVSDLAENRSFSRSGRSRGALKPSKEVGGFAPPTFLDGFRAPRGLHVARKDSAVARGGFSRGGFWIWLKIGRFRGLGGPGCFKTI